jgi:hypothetical protein
MNPISTVSPNRRSKVIHPGTPNARFLLFTSVALVLLSATQLALFDKASGAFLPNLLDICVILAGVTGFFFAYRHLGTFTIPAESPREFADYRILRNALQYQSIYGKDNVIISKRGLFHFLLALIPDANLVSLNPRIRGRVMKEAVKGARCILVTVAILIWAIFSSSTVALPYLIVGLAYSAFYIWTIWYFRSWSGVLTTRHLGSAMIESAGHPQTLFQLLENRVRSLHGNAGPMRTIAQPPAMQKTGVENTGTFESFLLYELPPEVIDAGSLTRFGTIVTPIASIGLVAGVWMLHLGLTATQSFAFYFCVIGALCLSGLALQLAWRLDTRFRFASNIILITLEGTFFQASVTVGKSLYDSHESQNTAVRSDIRMNCYACEAQSETPGMMVQRELVGAQASPRAAELIDLFTFEGKRFGEKGVSPIAMEFDGSSSEINKYNLGVVSARAAIQASATGGVGQQPAQPEPPAQIAAPTAMIEQGDGMKTCPDCAESVKKAARKCRFCGHIFEE